MSDATLANCFEVTVHIRDDTGTETATERHKPSEALAAPVADPFESSGEEIKIDPPPFIRPLPPTAEEETQTTDADVPRGEPSKRPRRAFECDFWSADYVWEIRDFDEEGRKRLPNKIYSEPFTSNDVQW